MRYAAAFVSLLTFTSPAIAQEVDDLYGPSVYDVYRHPETRQPDVSTFQGSTYVTRSPGCELYCVDSYYNPLTGANGNFVSSPR